MAATALRTDAVADLFLKRRIFHVGGFPKFVLHLSLPLGYPLIHFKEFIPSSLNVLSRIRGTGLCDLP
jgi:hypothetical protein